MSLKDWTVSLPDIDKLTREVVWCLGMESSKSFLCGRIIALFETYKYLSLADPWRHYDIARGSPMYGVIMATTEKQGKNTSFAHLKEKLKNIEFFNQLGYSPDPTDIRRWPNTDHISFPTHNFQIIVAAGNSSSIAGLRSKWIIAEELARQPDTTGRLGGKMIYQTTRRQLALPDSIYMTITSPIWEMDQSMVLLNLSKEIGWMFGLNLPTWEFNPKKPRDHPDIIQAFKEDPEAAMRDWGAKPSFAREPFFKEPEMIDRAMDHSSAIGPGGVMPAGKFEGWSYLALDPARVGTSFAFAVGRFLDRPVIDGVHRFTPDRKKGIEVREDDIIEFCKSLENHWKFAECVFDTHQFPGVIDYLKDQGYTITKRFALKDQYDYLKTQIYEENPKQRASLPNHGVLRNELRGLELVKGRQVSCRRDIEGKEHLTGKDLADVVANCIYLMRDKVMPKDMTMPSGR